MFKTWREMTPDELRSAHTSTAWYFEHPVDEDCAEVHQRALDWIVKIAAERGINLEETTNA